MPRVREQAGRLKKREVGLGGAAGAGPAARGSGRDELARGVAAVGCRRAGM